MIKHVVADNIKVCCVVGHVQVFLVFASKLEILRTLVHDKEFYTFNSEIHP